MPMGGGMNPLFGANPFAMNNPFMNQRPREEAPDEGGFNVDDLVKRIDAKIAELEEEERREKEEEEKKNRIIDAKVTEPNVTEAPVVEENKEDEEIPEPVIINEEDNGEEIPKVNIPVQQELPRTAPVQAAPEQPNSNLYSDDTDEDNFFDDFFSDEE